MELLLRGNAALALASAILWGGGDFSGGAAVKAASGTMRSAFRVVLLSHAVSLVTLFALSLAWGGARRPNPDLAWGIVAGILAALSLTTFYVALSGGAMGAAAALSGLLAAIIPASVHSSPKVSPELFAWPVLRLRCSLSGWSRPHLRPIRQTPPTAGPWPSPSPPASASASTSSP